MGAGTDLRYMWAKMWTFVEHRWKASWEAFPPPEAHVAQMSVGHKLWLCGMHMSMLDMEVKAKQVGISLDRLVGITLNQEETLYSVATWLKAFEIKFLMTCPDDSECVATPACTRQECQLYSVCIIDSNTETWRITDLTCCWSVRTTVMGCLIVLSTI